MDLVNPNYNDFFIYGFCYGRFKYYDVKEFLKYEFADAENPREGYQLDNQAKSDLQKLQILIGEKYIRNIVVKNCKANLILVFSFNLSSINPINTNGNKSKG